MKHLISLSLFLAVIRLSRAEAPPPETAALQLELTPQFINGLAEEVRTNNPALRAAGARTEAAAANVASVRSWDDPMVRVGGMFADPMMREEDGDLLYGVQQKLPLFGRPRAMRRMAEREHAVMAADRDASFQERRRDLAQALFRTAYLQRAADIGGQDLAWLASMVRTTEDRYRVGEMPQTYLLRLQNEHARRGDALLTDERRVVEALAGVNRLLGRPIDSAWPRLRLPAVAGEVTYNERLVELALAQEPRLQTLREAVRVADASVELSRRLRSPEVIAGVEGRNYTGNGDFRQAMVTLSVSLPWLNAGRYNQDVRRETARRQAAELDLTDSEWRVREEVCRLTVGIDAARREALLYRDQIVPRSEQALASARASWMSNRATFLDVMESRRMLIEARLMYARAVAEQYQMLSELVLCCGLGDLEALVMIGASAPSPTRPPP